MASNEDIFNRFLVKLQKKRVSTIDDPRVADAKAILGSCRQELLSKHLWVFAKRTFQLNRDGTDPDHKYNYRYTKPPDMLRNWYLSPDERMRGRIRFGEWIGQYFHTDHEEVYALYSIDVTNPNDMDPLFRKALAFYIGMEVAPGLAGTSGFNLMQQAYDAAITEATFANSIIEPPELEGESSWVTARWGGGGGLWPEEWEQALD